MIPTRIHGSIDWAVAAALGGLSQCTALTPQTRRVLGGSAAWTAGYSAVTDYEAGLLPLLSMRLHLAFDTAGAAGLLAGSLLLRDVPDDERTLLWATGLVELGIIAASDRRRRRAAEEPVTYPPLDVPKPVADGVWIVDSGPHHVAGMAPPVRMTVVRLPGGDLLLHAPTRANPRLRGELAALGRVRHLVAPNLAHWMYLKQWQAAGIVTWAAPGLRGRRAVRRARVRIDHELTERAPAEWGGALEIVMVPGGGGFREAALFHPPSRTLLLADLAMELERRKLPAFTRLAMHVGGTLAPHGRAPLQLRMLLTLRRRAAAAAARRLLALEPARVVFAHGRWFERDGAERLRRSLAWLVE